MSTHSTTPHSTIGILGCGDFLRWMNRDIARSQNVRVKWLFDPEKARAEKYALLIGGQATENENTIFEDAEVDTVYAFVPPWVRRSVVERAAQNGKHVLTTKPLGPGIEECRAIIEAAKPIKTGVIYRRTGSALFETYRQILESGEVGKLALFKQDWIHHYPQWNTWATDPARNGGPFMDAMIHNLNIARYLMNRPTTHCTYFSDNHTQTLKCNDTEFLKLDFEEQGSAHLFITWAANLAVYGTEGNDREHIEQQFMVTSENWYLTDDSVTIRASRDRETKTWRARALSSTPFDAFADTVLQNAPLRSDIASLDEAFEDIRILREAEKHLGVRHPVGRS